MNIPYSGGPGLEALVPSAGEPSALRVASRRHHAWQSAMEQAQLAGWFKPGAGTGHAREQAEVLALASPPVVRERSGMLPGDGAGQSAQAPIPRSVSSLAVSQALHAAGEVDQVPVGASAALASGAESLSGMSVPGGFPGPAAPVAEGATLQLAAQVWRQIGASIPAHMPQAVGMAMPAGAGLALSQTMQDEPVSAGSGAQQLRTPAIPVAAMAPRTDAPTVAAGAGAVVRQDDAGQAEAPEGPFMGQSRASRATAAVPPGNATDDEAVTAMRVHVDWSEQGASVWLGVNHERLASLPALARQLDQWFLASGVKLASLVCNGRTIPTRFSQRRSE